MRILHTSDWHIGKRIAGRERLEEQQAILSEIADLCESERIELVLIAGDVFDTFLPSAEAEDLFYAAVKKIAAGKRAVVAISGNHDDNVRLTAATALSEEQGIYIFGNSGRVPRLSAAGSIRAADAGKSHILFENERGERTFVHALPYPNEARLKETKNADESYFDKMRRWMGEGERCNAQGDPSVFLAHIFVAGGKVSDSEREIDLGGARAVPLELLPRCDYAALGHLHRRQSFAGNVCYSGSIAQYAFDEAGLEKSVNVFCLDRGGVHDLRRIPLHAGKQLVRLQADGAELAEELLRRYENCYIELTLRLREPLTSAQVRGLKEANGGLVSLIPQVDEGLSSYAAAGRKQLSAGELFSEFYKSRFQSEPSQELKQLFLSAMEEAHEA